MLVVQVINGKELEIRDRLLEMGISALVPESFVYKRYKSEWHEELTVIFKGYIFLDMEFNAANYYAVRAIDHVIDFLKAGDTVLHLSFIEMEWIRVLNSDEMKVPCRIKFNEDGDAVLSDSVIGVFKGELIKVNKHKRVAEFTLNIAGVDKKVAIGVDIAE